MTPPAPPPSISFEGLDFGTFGAGHPPDTNGDVGPTYYIQTINTSIGIYNKNTGVRVTAFSFNTFLNGHFGNLCDTNNFGDPVVVYDTFEDRWVITDFAFMLSGGFPVAPAYQCFAVSKSGDPVGGGWNFYSIQFSGGLGDYPKFGIWPDGLYMSANMFGFGPGGSFQNVRVWAFNKVQMYAGTSTVQVLSFDAPSNEFTLLPANARLQTGTPPAGSPNYFAVVWRFLNAVSVYKFQVNWNSISTSTFSGPFTSITATLWAQYLNAGSTFIPSPANNLDSLYPRLMMQNQYSNIGGVESLWASHTVGAGNPTSPTTSSQAAVRYYQVKVTGGAVESNATQSFTYSPDATLFRFMPSVEVDRAGDMAIGYSASNATTNPVIRYAGRLAGDAVNSITQTETSLIDGTGSQSGNCGGSACTRWGDYSAMTLDLDGCTFWYTNMYYQVNGLNHHTRIGAFSFPSCTPASTGTLQGNVTASGSGNPIQGATVALGSRTTTTDASGNYSFTGLPSGTYPSLTASFPGYVSGSATSIVVNDGSTTTQNFSLTLAPTSGCLTDTTQADFQTGVPTNCDLTTSPGDVILASTASIDQQNTTVTNNGFGFNSTNWAGQTFTAGVTGQLTRVDLELFCFTCTGTTPNITVSIRATSGSPAVPTGGDLATATITGFSSGAGIYYSANFSSPPTLSAGTTYAVIFRAVSNPSAGTYAYVCSCTPDSNPYPNGQRVTSADSGATWTADIFSGGRDLGFKTYMKTGFVSSGTFVSSLKDANPTTGVLVHWNTLSWTAATPANTAIQFQAAASNSASGPFNFVGPDGTAGTFFTNGGSLAQFNGNRYLKYEAFLTTTNNAVTPTLNDVTVCFTNGKGNTATALASSTNPSVFGQTVTFTATVSPVPPATGTPTGTVTFLDGGSPIGTGMLSGGQATFMTSALAAGSHTITTTYGGDANFNASAGSLTGNPQVVSRASTLVGLAASPPSPSNFPVTVTFTATITVVPPGAGTPSGTVTFKEGATVLGSTFFSGTTASFSTNALSIGSHTITATYNGDSNFNGSTSTVLNYTVNATTTVAAITNVTVTHSPIKRVNAIGGQVTYTITVSTNSATGVHAVLNLSPDGAPTQVVGNQVDPGVNCTGGVGSLQCEIPLLQSSASKHVTLVLETLFSDFRTFTGIASIAANTTGDTGTHYAADTINLSLKPFGR